MGKRIKKVILYLLVIIIFGVVCFWCYNNRDAIGSIIHRDDAISKQVVDENVESPDPIITSEFINSKLELISDLSTAKITYGCMCDLKDGSIPVINKKGFSMYYEATAKAGINISNITNEVTEDKVVIQLPPAEIQDCKIEANSIVFYDVDNSLFNSVQPSDVPIALSYAEKDVYYQATTDQLLDIADENAVNLITALLSGYVGDLQIVVQKGERGSMNKVQPPYSSADVVKMNYKVVIDSFERHGFTNIIENKIPDIKVGVFAKEGDVESVKIGEKTEFKKSNIFDANTEVVVTYHVRKD